MTRSGRQADRAMLEQPDSSTGDLEQQQAPNLQPVPAESLAADASGTGGTAKSQRRPTWSELSDKQTNVPLDESLTRAAAQPPKADNGVITFTSANRPAKSGLSRFLGGAQPKRDEAVQQSACSIDPNDRRLIDFKLPDLSGKMVSLHDIDADVILLDFWGSWCKPCRKSIPHLIELQSKMAGKRVQVIGIACEKAASAADRQASAAKAVSATGYHLSRAALEPRRIVPTARGATDPVLPDNGAFEPRRPPACARARSHRHHPAKDGPRDCDRTGRAAKKRSRLSVAPVLPSKLKTMGDLRQP